MRGYQPIEFATFATKMQEMGFAEIKLPGTQEHVWERSIECPLTQGRFKVRIYSSIANGTSREVGADAIRVQVFDTARERSALDLRRVHRTENALANTIERAREAYGYVSKHAEHHCTCGGLFVARKGKFGPFMSCTSCRTTRPVTEAA